VGGVGAIVLVLALAWWMYGVTAGSTGANTGSQNSTVGAAGETQAQLRQQAVPATTGADGKQNIDVVLNSATFQYEPKVIEVKQGTPVHFNLSVKNGDPGCGRVVTIRGLGASVEVVPGQESSLDFMPTQAGTYVMTCEMNMFGPGYVIVTQ
jgi:plastocyanin domain-containing protein